MALMAFYKFRFESEQGAEYSINVMKNNYAGSVLQRPLGGSPVLRRDKSDNILGTSLEFPAECNVDGEFAELYTSNARKYRVDFRDASNNLVWQGFITPELYSEPDIAPPYDVTLTATDGLGELKRVDFAKCGPKTLRDHLSDLLDNTGLSLPIEIASDLRPNGSTSKAMLDDVIVDLDHLDGETCYDTLQALLRTLNAKITQYKCHWLIFRETGLTVTTNPLTGDTVVNTSLEGSSFGSSIVAIRVGSATVRDWWPVGQLSSQVVPAKHAIRLSAPNFYKKNLLRDNQWTAISGATYDSTLKAWDLTTGGDGITQRVGFATEVGEKLVLSIMARNIGNGASEGNLAVDVVASGTDYTGSVTYYLANAEKSHRNNGTDFEWKTTAASCGIVLQAPAEEDTDSDYVELQVVIPLYRSSERSFFRADDLQISIRNQDGSYPKRIYGVFLTKYEQVKGWQQVVDIDNDAREEAPDVDLTFSRVCSATTYSGMEDVQTGIPATTAGRIATWLTNTFSAMDYMSLMARDYAVAVAAPRLRKNGTVNVPTSHYLGVPPFMSDGTSVYIIETGSWRIADDELDIDAITVPSATITVENETIEGGESSNATSHTQGVSAGSSPSPTPGGGTVTSVSLAVPTNFFTVTGSPVTQSGTITIGLKSTTKILTVNEYQYINDRVHSHNNSSVLDGITRDLINSWNTAASWGNHANAGYIKPGAGTWSLTQISYVVHCTAAEYAALTPRNDTLYIVDN